MRFIEDDGGRLRAGWKGNRASDCVPRAITIATGHWQYVADGQHYRNVRTILDAMCKKMTGGLTASSNRGTPTPVSHKYLTGRGWELVLTKGKYLKDLPKSGTFIACLTRHYVAVIDNVLYDTWDSRHSNRTKCGSPPMKGYYRYDASRKIDKINKEFNKILDEHDLRRFIK